MIQDTLLPKTSLPSGDQYIISESFQPKTSQELLCKMLIYPYTKLSDTDYYGLLGRIVTGDTGNDLGRPKFIGDQLWNKSLLNETYHTQSSRPDESGPRAHNAQARAFSAMIDDPSKLFRTMQMVFQSVLTDTDGASLRQLFITLLAIVRDVGNPPRNSPTGPRVRISNSDVTTIADIIKAIISTKFNVDLGELNYSTLFPVVQFLVQVFSVVYDAAPASVQSVDYIVSLFRNVGTSNATTDAVNQFRGYVVAATDALPVEYRDVARSVINLLSQNTEMNVPRAGEDPSTRHNRLFAPDVINLGVFLVAYTMFSDYAKNNIGELSKFQNNSVLQFPIRDETTGMIKIERLSISGDDAKFLDPSKVRQDLASIGRIRFDNTLVRDIFFIVNLQRVMRMIMRDEMAYLEAPVVSASSVINRQITEYENNEVYNRDVFYP
jgi:hypothetical protein